LSPKKSSKNKPTDTTQHPTSSLHSNKSITTAVLSLGPRKTKYTSKHTMSLEVSSGSNDEVANNRNMKSNQSLFETEKTRMLIMAK
jgi:hypothetical protein